MRLKLSDFAFQVSVSKFEFWSQLKEGDTTTSSVMDHLHLRSWLTKPSATATPNGHVTPMQRSRDSHCTCFGCLGSTTKNRFDSICVTLHKVANASL